MQGIRLAVWLVGLLGGMLLSACGAGRNHYLAGAVGHASEQAVIEELGRPDQIVQADAGRTVWIYERCHAPISCSVWLLTFDRTMVLRTWEQAPEHL